MKRNSTFSKPAPDVEFTAINLLILFTNRHPNSQSIFLAFCKKRCKLNTFYGIFFILNFSKN